MNWGRGIHWCVATSLTVLLCSACSQGQRVAGERIATEMEQVAQSPAARKWAGLIRQAAKDAREGRWEDAASRWRRLPEGLRAPRVTPDASLDVADELAQIGRGTQT